MTEGERWTRDELDELRAERFAPGAWRRFLAASFARARVQRREHPRAHAQTLALGVLALLAWMLVWADGRPGLAIVGTVWLVLVLLMVDWHLGMLERADGRRLDGLGAANATTVLRTAAIPAFGVVDRSALLVALTAFVSLDLLDGWLARRRHEETRLGAWLDGSSDSVAAVVLVVAAERLDAIPSWLVVLVVARVAAPVLVLSVAYFAAPTCLPARLWVRAPGVAVRLPAVAAAAGIGLALADVAGGVPLAASGAALSLLSFAAVVGRHVAGSRRAVLAP